MAEKGLILPNAPLFMVDRSLRQQKSSKPASTTDSPASLADNVKITEAGRDQGARTTQKLSRQHAPSTSTKASKGQDFRFVAATEPGGRQNRDARRTVRQQARRYEQRPGDQTKSKRRNGDSVETTVFVPPNTDVDELEASMAAKLTLVRHVPGSSTVLYGQPSDQEPTGLEQFLHYYRCVIARSCNPLERHLSLDVDPVKKSCFPLVLSDRLFLQTVLLVSAVHYSCVLKGQEPIGTDALAHRVVKELRRRVEEKDIADTTLLSVSCIAIVENMMGHHQQWNIHNSGIRQMVSVRGGVHTIDAAIRWKLYRSDLVGAIDSMGKPLLPRPSLETIPTMVDPEIEVTPDHLFDELFAHSEVSAVVQSTFRDIRLVVNAIDYGIKSNKCLDFIAFDSHCTRINFNLLQAETANALDEVCRIVGLSFTSTLTTLYPFLRAKCAVVSCRLRSLFQRIPTKPSNKMLYLWLGFMGALVSSNTDDYPWFVQFLMPIIRECQCSTWDGAQDMLSEVLWLRPLHKGAGFKIWEDTLTMETQHLTS